MFIGGTLIFLAVLMLTYLAIRRRPPWLASHRAIVAGGVIFPVVTLTALLVYGLAVGRDVGGNAENPLRIEVVGEQYWWRVHYLDDKDRVVIADANELHIPTGRTVELTLRTADVIHSFWVPNLAGKLDMIPGHSNTLRMRADQPGVYRGQCAEYCGDQHAFMAFYVVVQEPETFDEWLTDRTRPVGTPANEHLGRGQSLFISSGCGACHAIRGTSAVGTLGPDLTHVGSRRSLGAGMFPNNRGTLAGWITSSQHLKPGNAMPSFDVLNGDELLAIAAYLESLK